MMLPRRGVIVHAPLNPGGEIPGANNKYSLDLGEHRESVAHRELYAASSGPNWNRNPRPDACLAIDQESVTKDRSKTGIQPSVNNGAKTNQMMCFNFSTSQKAASDEIVADWTP